MSDEWVYRFPDGRVQWNPNIYATKVRLADLPKEQQEKLRDQKRNAPTLKEKLRQHAEKFDPVLSDKPATRVRVLLACDTDAEGGIAPGVAVDLRMMRSFFAQAFRRHPGLCEVERLSGKDLTADNIIKYYEDLRSSPTETLVFYYAGHGGMGHRGHFLALTHGRSLPRSELLAEMQKRPHQCLILLTDCCSNTTGYNEDEANKRRARIRELLKDDAVPQMRTGFDPRTVEWLFLRHTGNIDITAADPSRDQFAWTSSETGGFFTNALVRVLRTDVNTLNKGKPRRVRDQVTWPMAFWRIQQAAAMMSLGRTDFPPAEVLMRTPAKDRDRIWQWAYAFSFH